MATTKQKTKWYGLAKARIVERGDGSLGLDLFLTPDQLEVFTLENGNQPQNSDGSIFKRITVRPASKEVE